MANWCIGNCFGRSRPGEPPLKWSPGTIARIVWEWWNNHLWSLFLTITCTIVARHISMHYIYFWDSMAPGTAPTTDLPFQILWRMHLLPLAAISLQCPFHGRLRKTLYARGRFLLRKTLSIGQVTLNQSHLPSSEIPSLWSSGNKSTTSHRNTGNRRTADYAVAAHCEQLISTENTRKPLNRCAFGAVFQFAFDDFSFIPWIQSISAKIAEISGIFSTIYCFNIRQYSQ